MANIMHPHGKGVTFDREPVPWGYGAPEEEGGTPPPTQGQLWPRGNKT